MVIGILHGQLQVDAGGEIVTGKVACLDGAVATKVNHGFDDAEGGLKETHDHASVTIKGAEGGNDIGRCARGTPKNFPGGTAVVWKKQCDVR